MLGVDVKYLMIMSFSLSLCERALAWTSRCSKLFFPHCYVTYTHTHNMNVFVCEAEHNLKIVTLAIIAGTNEHKIETEQDTHEKKQQQQLAILPFALAKEAINFAY